MGLLPMVTMVLMLFGVQPDQAVGVTMVPPAHICGGLQIGRRNAPLGPAKCADQSLQDCDWCWPGDINKVANAACKIAALEHGCLQFPSEPDGGSGQ